MKPMWAVCPPHFSDERFIDGTLALKTYSKSQHGAWCAFLSFAGGKTRHQWKRHGYRLRKVYVSITLEDNE